MQHILQASAKWLLLSYISWCIINCIVLHFQLVSATKESIQAHHTSSDKTQVESLEFDLHTTVLTSSCRVSVSHADAHILTWISHRM